MSAEENLNLMKTLDDVWNSQDWETLTNDIQTMYSIAEFTGTHKGPMTGLDGKMIPPAGKSFKVDFCTVAHWKNGRIVEENLFYDLVGLMKQLGLM